VAQGGLPQRRWRRWDRLLQAVRPRLVTVANGPMHPHRTFPFVRAGPMARFKAPGRLAISWSAVPIRPMTGPWSATVTCAAISVRAWSRSRGREWRPSSTRMTAPFPSFLAQSDARNDLHVCVSRSCTSEPQTQQISFNARTTSMGNRIGRPVGMRTGRRRPRGLGESGPVPKTGTRTGDARVPDRPPGGTRTTAQGQRGRSCFDLRLRHFSVNGRVRSHCPTQVVHGLRGLLRRPHDQRAVSF